LFFLYLAYCAALEPMQREGEEGLKREEITVSANIKYKML